MLSWVKTRIFRLYLQERCIGWLKFWKYAADPWKLGGSLENNFKEKGKGLKENSDNINTKSLIVDN